MFIKKTLLAGLSLSLMLVGIQSAKAQSVAETTFETDSSAVVVQGGSVELANLESAQLGPVEADMQASDQSVEVAQARRRTRRTVRQGSDFIGIGADFGYADDVSFAVISKLSINDTIAVRPSVLIGDDFSVLVPVTYEFSQFSTQVDDFQIRPYAGVGAAYSDDDDDDDFNLLLAAGADIPVSQRFTVNAQANLGVLGDTDFGVTVGVGYNFGRIFR